MAWKVAPLVTLFLALAAQQPPVNDPPNPYRTIEHPFTMPDGRTNVTRLVAGESSCAAEWRIEGTFTGEPYMGIEPTGKHVELRGLDQAHGSTLDHHVHRLTRLGTWVLISGSWYYSGGFHEIARQLRNATNVRHHLRRARHLRARGTIS